MSFYSERAKALNLTEEDFIQRLEMLERELEAKNEKIKDLELYITEELQLLFSEIRILKEKIPQIERVDDNCLILMNKVFPKDETHINNKTCYFPYSQSAKYAESVYEKLRSQPIVNDQKFLLPKEEVNFLISKFPELKRSKNIYLVKDRINETVTMMYDDVDFLPEPITNYNKSCKKRPRKILKIKEGLI